MENKKSIKLFLALFFVTLFLISCFGNVSGSQEHQSAFQGTWIGERQPVDRTQNRIVITGTNWTSYFRGEIQAGGTARFYQGRAELRLANGEVYWNLNLLAPGLLEQPITMWDGYYRFKKQ